MHRLPSLVTTAAFLATSLLAVNPTQAQAAAGAESVSVRLADERGVCYKREESISTTKGRKVLLPSSLATGWSQGKGTISVTFTEGEDVAKTEGSSDSVGGSAGVSVGPVQASGEYNHEWNRSTTSTSSASKAYRRDFDAPKTGTWRIRWFQMGYEFRLTKRLFFTNCPMKEGTFLVRLPIGVNPKENHVLRLESYSKRNRVLPCC